MMVKEEITIIVVSVLCVLIVIAAIIAVAVYFCCGHKKRRKQPTRYQLPAPESTNSQSTPGHQDEPSPPKPLPKVGSSGLWMSKPIMHAQGPNDAYHQLKPNGIREPVLMREILSTPNVSQPTSGYIYQGNLRMYHSQQLPSLVSGYGEHRGAYYNEAFIYPTYVDAGLSHRSSMRFLEASGYYAPEHMSRENHHRASRHQSQRDSSEIRVPRSNGDVRQSSAKPSRYQPKSPQHEQRNSRSIESRSSSKNKSASSSTVSGAESVIERSAIHEATKSAASDPVRSSITEEGPSHYNDDVRTQADGKMNTEVGAPSTSMQPELDISLDNLGLRQEQRDIPSDQQSYVDSVSDITDMESKGQKITSQAFEFLDTYISDGEEDMDRPKYYSGKS